MTERQVSWFRELLAPFPAQSYYTVRGFSYIKSQTIENRLDDVAGPMGWVAEFIETKGGYKCRLKIYCPDDTADGWAWHYKENGAGAEDMVKTSHGEQIADEDNSEKSAYTNSFKRAASKWGFGRDLYNCGMPQYLADLYPKTRPTTQGFVEPRSSTNEYRTQDGYTRASDAEVATRQPPPQQDGQRQVNLGPPTTARQVFPWLKNIEQKFGISLVDTVNQFCTETFGFWDTRKLNDQQVINLVSWVIGQVQQWHNYDGCFNRKDEVIGHRQTAFVPPAARPAGSGNLKPAIVAAAKEIIFKQTGREARDQEIVACIGELAARSPNYLGISGEVMMSLKSCADEIWMKNILDAARDQMARATALQTGSEVNQESDNIPF